jgi:DNA-binding response OmpR family regulator
VSKKILCVDDDVSIRTILEHTLGQSFDVATVEDGEKAVAWIAAEGNPDCMVVDLQMPGLNGFDLIKKVRGEQATKKIPLIVLSSKESSDEKIKSLNLGADDYLLKPFNPEELTARIESIFRRIA